MRCAVHGCTFLRFSSLWWHCCCDEKISSLCFARLYLSEVHCPCDGIVIVSLSFVSAFGAHDNVQRNDEGCSLLVPTCLPLRRIRTSVPCINVFHFLVDEKQFCVLVHLDDSARTFHLRCKFLRRIFFCRLGCGFLSKLEVCPGRPSCQL